MPLLFEPKVFDLRIALLAWFLALAHAQDARAQPPAAEEKNSATRSKPARIDLYGDPLPSTAMRRLGTLRFRNNGSVQSIAFSPDGKLVASAATSRGIYVWELATGKIIGQWRLQDNRNIWSITFSPDGKTLASADGNQIHLINVGAAREFHLFSAEEEWLKDICFSPDGKTLASGGTDGVIRLWQVSSGKQLARLFGHDGEVHTVAFSPDGKTLASGGRDHTVRIWDVGIGKEVSVLRGHGFEVKAIAFSPDGKMLSSGDWENLMPAGKEMVIRLWDTQTGKEKQRLTGHRGSIVTLGFGQDGKTLVSASWDGTIRLWDPASGNVVRKMTDPTGLPSCVAFSPDRKMAASGVGNSIYLWDLAIGKRVDLFVGHEGPVTGAAFLDDGKTVSSKGWESSWRLWDVATAHQLRLFENEAGLYPLAFSKDGQALASTDPLGSRLHISEVASGKELYGWKMQPPARACYAVFSPDGKTLAIGQLDNSISLWDLHTRNQLRQLNSGLFALAQLEFSPDGTLLASGYRGGGRRQPGTIVLWDVATGTEARRITIPLCSLLPFTFSPDGRTLASGTREGAVLWELLTVKERCRLVTLRSAVYSLAFSPDGMTLASGNEDAPPVVSAMPEAGVPNIRLWGLFTGHERFRRSGDRGTASSQVFAPERCRYEGHRGNILSLAFSPNAKTLVSTSEDTTILLWDVAEMLAGRDTSTKQESDHAQARQEPVSPNLLQSFWVTLSSEDAAEAYRAIGSLIGGGKDSVALLRDRMRLVPAADPQRLNQLIANLDSPDFAKRQQATRDLEKLGEPAQPALERAVASKTSAEVARRVKPLLEKLRAPITSGPKLQTLRAIEVLEHIGTPEAQEVLQTLAKGAPEAMITREAKASLDRLRKLAAHRP